MGLPALPFVITGLIWLANILGTAMAWLITRSAKRWAVVVIVLALLAALVIELDNQLRGLTGSVNTAVPDLGYFYAIMIPDNFTSVVTTYLASEVLFALYNWSYKLLLFKTKVIL